MNARVMILLTLLAAASPSHVTSDRLLRADREPHNWLSYSGNYSGHRYSPLSQINRTNVKYLQLKWSYHPLYAKNTNSQNKMENTPLVVDGIMYTGTALEAVALDAEAVAVDPTTGSLFAAQHGRDQLNANWPQLYTEAQSAELPAEEVFRIESGGDYGWPYCYYDWQRQQKVLQPEYGGDGKTMGRCESVQQPVVAFPGHWAPNAITFYSGRQFPQKYRGGLFVAFHGSWNRAPLPQAGFNVTFVPFTNGRAAGSYTVFAEGFIGAGREGGDALHRPTGLAVGPDGSLYVTDDRGGRLYRIMYRGR